MSLITGLLEKPAIVNAAAAKYSTINGFIYLALGVLLILWPGLLPSRFYRRVPSRVVGIYFARRVPRHRSVGAFQSNEVVTPTAERATRKP
ncbi:MAG: hypothetical protein ABI537_00315 [Casimicrobiaceae bacterium]